MILADMQMCSLLGRTCQSGILLQGCSALNHHILTRRLSLVSCHLQIVTFHSTCVSAALAANDGPVLVCRLGQQLLSQASRRGPLQSSGKLLQQLEATVPFQPPRMDKTLQATWQGAVPRSTAKGPRRAVPAHSRLPLGLQAGLLQTPLPCPA